MLQFLELDIPTCMNIDDEKLNITAAWLAHLFCMQV